MGPKKQPKLRRPKTSGRLTGRQWSVLLRMYNDDESYVQYDANTGRMRLHADNELGNTVIYRATMHRLHSLGYVQGFVAEKKPNSPHTKRPAYKTYLISDAGKAYASRRVGDSI